MTKTRLEEYLEYVNKRELEPFDFMNLILEDYGDFFDNGATLFKQFRRRIYPGETVQEYIQNIIRLVDEVAFEETELVAGLMNEVLSSDAEEILSLAKKHKIDIPVSIDEFKEEVRYLKEGDYAWTPASLAAINVCRQIVKGELPYLVSASVTGSHIYFDIVRLTSEIKGVLCSGDSLELMKRFFELGFFVSTLFAERGIHDFNLTGISERKVMRSKALMKVKGDIGKLLHIRACAGLPWRTGCRLLHTQMGKLLWVAIYDKTFKLKKINRELKLIAPKDLLMGKTGVTKEVLVCPCKNLGECRMDTHTNGKFFNLAETHMEETESIDTDFEFDSYEEALNAAMKKRKN